MSDFAFDPNSSWVVSTAGDNDAELVQPVNGGDTSEEITDDMTEPELEYSLHSELLES